MNEDMRIGLAEAIGTGVLVLGGAGTAIFATGTFDEGLSVGILGVALAFGLSLLTMAYLIGQFAGGIIGAGLIALILMGTDGYLGLAQVRGLRLERLR